MPTKTPTFEQWMNGATTNKKKSSCNSHNNTPDKDFSFDLCHGNNEGSETTPERRHTNICNPSPGVINTNRRSQHVNVPIPTMRKFPNIIDEKCRYQKLAQLELTPREEKYFGGRAAFSEQLSLH